ncbi:hypothetical protein [Salinicoccus roseus]|uniref:Uncharacterized protein n=1 Tax=Salinicoccus roseus TaxID=45670 RepID=A0A265E6I0_9STAP|nr:hypothetical protein [Salinicoccus roseus]OZT76848.1 hypothetical protein CFN03_10370 [Salinicoccus roseus]
MCNNLINELDLKRFQNLLVESFKHMFEFEDDNVKGEWSSMLVERELQIYSPRIDVAIGPFAETQSNAEIYDDLLRRAQIKRFVELLINNHRQNMNCLNIYDNLNTFVEYDELARMNNNARCFMAIEIENQVSRKHLMGGAINASALGRVGVLVPWTEDKLRAFARMIRYMAYLKEAEKNTFNTTNMLIVTKSQLINAIEVNSLININDLINEV